MVLLCLFFFKLLRRSDTTLLQISKLLKTVNSVALSEREAPGAAQLMGKVLLMEEFLTDDVSRMYHSFVEGFAGQQQE